MKALLNYLILPSEITEAEARHVHSINKVAMIVAYLHVPIFVMLGYLCGTGVVDALVLSALVLAGPIFGSKMIDDPRLLSLVFGFTSMCLGAVLVHLGQGSIQIEMHFHFFVFLALLAVYGNPMTIVVAAITVALHHAVFWLFLPTSIFNYDAAIWVVAIHALFVVLESVASCFIARNFFDNVIGLEKILKKRTQELDGRNRDMKLILDNTAQGFITVSMDGKVSNEKSAIISNIFEDTNSEIFWDWFSNISVNTGDMIKYGFNDLIDDFMPESVILGQMPQKFKKDKDTYKIEYQAIKENNQIKTKLIVLTNITSDLEQQDLENKQKETMKIFECIQQDRDGFVEFLDEADSLVKKISGNTESLDLEKRYLHTLKGNSGVFGITSLFNLCHDVENRIAEENILSKNDKFLIQEKWQNLLTTFSQYLGEEEKKSVHITLQELKDLLHKSQGLSREEVVSELHKWQYEPISLRFKRLAQQAQGLAKRLEIEDLEVEINDNNLRIPQEKWRGFWGSFIHVIRNSLDHGLREFSPQGVHPKIKLEATFQEELFVLSILDNGRGVNWDIVRQKSKSKGIPHETHEDLVNALFSDGLSTKNTASELSGRGVGMSSVYSECEKLGGAITVESQPNKGTIFTFKFPLKSVYSDNISLRAKAS